MSRVPKTVRVIAVGLAAAACAATAPRAAADPWFTTGDVLPYRMTLPYGDGLRAGFDGEPGEDDWYYDFYDLGYEYDDAYLDYSLDARDVGERLRADDLDADDLEDLRDRRGIAGAISPLEASVEALKDLDDTDGSPPSWSGDTYMDWDTLDDEGPYAAGGVYEGYGFN